jgi:hypothetical protein
MFCYEQGVVAPQKTGPTERQPDFLMKVKEIESAHEQGGFLQKYQEFIASVADHISVIALLLQILSKVLGSSGKMDRREKRMSRY